MALPRWSAGGGAGKPVVPLIAALIMISLGAMLWGQLEQVKRVEQQLKISQQQVHQLEAQNQELTQQLGSLEGQRKHLDERLVALRKELTEATDRLDRSRLSLDEFQGRYEELTQTRGRLEAQLAGVTAERDEARSQALRLEQDKSELERSAVRLRERLTLLDRDYRRVADQLAELQATPRSGVHVVASSGPTATTAAPAQGRAPSAPLNPGTVELPPIVVRKDQAGMSMPVRGRLVEVNEPHRFVVVDKGSMDGVRLGMTLDILRGGSAVGRATVVRVRPQLSACDVVRARTPGPLQVGDVAVQSGP